MLAETSPLLTILKRQPRFDQSLPEGARSCHKEGGGSDAPHNWAANVTHSRGIHSAASGIATNRSPNGNTWSPV